MRQLVRTGMAALAVSATAAGVAGAQRGGGGLPRLTTAAPAPARPAPAMPSRGGIMAVPRGGPSHPAVRSGDLPRLRAAFPRGSDPRGGIGQPGSSHRSRFWQSPSVRWRGVSGVCGFGCAHKRGFARGKHLSPGFFIGFPFAFPVYVPYAYDVTYTRYDDYVEPAYDVAYGEPRAAASKVIVVGAGGAGGDALTVETVADSVRLTWLGSGGRAVREVRLFVTDSAQRQLAARSASPARPTATFEVSTLSAPVAFAGVTVVFADGVTSTTVVPYRSGGPSGERR